MAFRRTLYNLYFFCKPFLDSSGNISLHWRLTEVELKRCERHYYGNTKCWVHDKAGETLVDHQMPTRLLQRMAIGKIIKHSIAYPTITKWPCSCYIITEEWVVCFALVTFVVLSVMIIGRESRAFLTIISPLRCWKPLILWFCNEVGMLSSFEVWSSGDYKMKYCCHRKLVFCIRYWFET